MEKTDDVFEIGKRDAIVHVRVWYHQQEHGFHRYMMPDENNGRVMGLELTTRDGASKRVLCGDVEDTVVLDFYTNTMEEIVSSFARQG